MYHGNGPDNHAVYDGREDIRKFWRTVVNDMQLVNMRATAPKYAVLSENDVLVSYDQVTFGQKGNEDGEIFKAVIHSELWTKKGDSWYVKLDITEAITK